MFLTLKALFEFVVPFTVVCLGSKRSTCFLTTTKHTIKFPLELLVGWFYGMSILIGLFHVEVSLF